MFRRYMILILPLVLIPLFAMMAAASQKPTDFSSGSPTANENRQRGLVYAGLHRDDKCGDNGWADSFGDCTSGPEPAPEGIDVTQTPSTQELYAEANENVYPPCFGDGTSGKRVQAIYAVASDKTDRYEQIVPLIQTTYTYRMNNVYRNTAIDQGGMLNIRFVTGADCKVDVAHAVVTPSGDDSLSSMRTELRNQGFNSTDRKYIVWMDSDVYCGIGNIKGDTDPLPADNANDSGPTFGRIDARCWGNTSSVEAHELAHTLGAVQLNTPNSNGAWHCVDEHDRMCYNDGSGATLVYLCDSSQEYRFDCNKDDYFSLNPTSGSYLETHWNIVNSSFLTQNEGLYPEPDPTPTPTTSSPEPTPTTTSPSPEPTKTKWPKKCAKNPNAPGCSGYPG